MVDVLSPAVVILREAKPASRLLALMTDHDSYILPSPDLRISLARTRRFRVDHQQSINIQANRIVRLVFELQSSG